MGLNPLTNKKEGFPDACLSSLRAGKPVWVADGFSLGVLNVTASHAMAPLLPRPPLGGATLGV